MFSMVSISLLVVAIAMLASMGKRLRSMQADIGGLTNRIHDLRRRIDALQQAAPPVAPSPAAADTAAPKPLAVATPAVTVATVPAPATSAVAPPPLPPPLPSSMRTPPAPPPARSAPAAPAAPPPIPPPASEPAPPPATPPARSRLAETTAEILHKIWNWILVGEEHRPQGVTTEYAVATTWLLRLGILAVVLCVAYFLVWSSERNLVGPVGRVAIVLFVGVAVLAGGVRLLGRRYHLLGQGLMGGGLLMLYFGVYAMGPRYDLVPAVAAFALMVLVTATAGVLALRLDSLLVATIGIAGGYLTPALIRTPSPNLPVFYTYLLALGLAILAIAWRKQWRLLNYLSFLFTYGLFLASLAGPYDSARHFPLAIGFLAAFFVTQSSLVYLHNIVRRQPSAVLEIVQLTLNTLLTSLIGYGLIRDAVGRPYPAFLALALAVYFTAHVLALLRRRSEDRRLVVACLALAAACATWTLPLVMEKESLTIALSLLALTILWLGMKLESRFLQNLAYLLYAAVFFRLAVWDFSRNYGGPAPADQSLRAYAHSMLDRLWTFGLSVASVACAFWLQRRQPRAAASALRVAPAADTPGLLPPTFARGIFYWAALVLLFGFLHAEFAAMFELAPPWRLPVLTTLWCALGLYFLLEHRAETGTGSKFWAMTTVLVIAAVKLLAVDAPSWGALPDGVCGAGYHLVDAATRLLDIGALLAAILLAWRALAGREATRAAAPLFGYGALLLFFLYATLETNTLLHWTLPRFQAGGISMLWALFALGFIVAGIARSIPLLRFLGLGLVAIVIAKVFLVDLQHMEVIVRVVAFLAVGILLLLGSFAYMRSGRKFTRNDAASEVPPTANERE